MPSKKKRITLYVTPEELERLTASAARAGASLSTFCSRVSLGYNVPGLEHYRLRMELRHLRGDLGRIGGLVKLALSQGADRHLIHKLLHELDNRQREVHELFAQVK